MKKKMIGLSLMFFLVASSNLAADGASKDKFDPSGLWKTQYLDTVVEITKCKQDEYCSKIYWLNDKDKNIYRWYGKDAKNKTNISKADVRTLCDYKPNMSVTGNGENRWQGNLYVPGLNMRLKMDINQTDNNTAIVKGTPKSRFLSWYKKTETWKRVQYGDKKYPYCGK